VVLMHESGHALATLLVGGSVDRIQISPDQGGVTFSRYPPSLLRAIVISSAGYVGSTVSGCVLLWIAARGMGIRTGGSLVGWPTDAFLAIAGAVVGYGSHGLGAPEAGPPLAAAAGFALAALSVLPVVHGRDVMRIGIGLGLLLGGVLLVRTNLGGTPEPLEQVLTAGLVATLGGAVAILAVAARSDGRPGFELSTTTPHRASHASDAHPLEPR